MSEDRLAKSFKALKQQCLETYEANTIGDLKNSKNQSYITKLKNELRQRHAVSRKQNVDSIKNVSCHLFEQLLNMSVRQKHNQRSYKSLTDFYADLTYVQTEFVNQIESPEMQLQGNVHAMMQLYELSYKTVSQMS